MKIKSIFIVYFMIFTCGFANEITSKINDLQRQIDELKIKNYNSYSSVFDNLKINGRLHINYSFYDEDLQLKSFSSSSYQNKLSIRRARLSINNKVGDFDFRMDVNLKDGKAFLSQTYIAYNFNKNSNIKIGQVIPPSFMSKEKSSNTMATIDYNSFITMGWLDSYVMGAKYSYYGDNIGFSGGIFTQGLENSNSTDNLANYNILIRNFYTPIFNDDFILHIGYDLSYQDYKNDFTKNTQYIKNRYYYGLELAFQYKFINVNNEFIKMYYEYDKNRFNGNKFDFYGLSTEFVVNFTGEQRKYNKDGYFAGINVKNPLSKGGLGAFQGVFSYSMADGKDTSNGFLNNIGSGYSYVVGLNWLPEDYCMFLLNYSYNKVVKRNYSLHGKYNAIKLEARLFF